jgi:hypothetical protein
MVNKIEIHQIDNDKEVEIPCDLLGPDLKSTPLGVKLTNGIPEEFYSTSAIAVSSLSEQLTVDQCVERLESVATKSGNIDIFKHNELIVGAFLTYKVRLNYYGG